MILYPNQLIDVGDLPHKYRHLDVDDYEPDYPEELLEREALNALFSADADSEDDSFDENTTSTELPPEGINLKEYISEMEVSLISQALEQQDWVVARPAVFHQRLHGVFGKLDLCVFTLHTGNKLLQE